MAKFSKQKGKVTIKKKVLKEHFSKRREEKEKKKALMSELTQKEEEDGDIGLIDENANFFADYMSKNFKVKKGLFPFKGGLPSFFRDPICTFKWEKLFEGVFEVRVDVVNRFYKGFINDDEDYVIVKGK